MKEIAEFKTKQKCGYDNATKSIADVGMATVLVAAPTTHSALRGHIHTSKV